MTHRLMIPFLLALMLGACGTKDTTERYPLRDDLHGYHFEVTTASAEAQEYFDQGFILYYGFNHEGGDRIIPPGSRTGFGICNGLVGSGNLRRPEH